ncbi:hypothetical protein [Candidiatus Paracoxiella cheracis]|uniref:hypothetical protein n=1 Tax=Candidiatus Paracoxiella cheracis TaxID=3405120 RepID=UPI003BF56D4D
MPSGWIKNNLDPKLNEQAFEFCPLKKELSVDQIKKELPDDWLDQLCRQLLMLDIHKQEKIKTVNVAKKHFERHFDKKLYANVSDLTEQLQLAFWYSTHSDSLLLPEVKQRLVLSINEGLKECSEGLHNRLNSELLTLGEMENLKQLLTLVRTKKVSAAFASLLNDHGGVHTYNSFSKIARDLGFGVSMINPKDRYFGFLEFESVRNHLTKFFKTEYRAFNLPNLLFDELKNIFIKLGYDGEKGKGYSADVYLKIEKQLKSLMPVLANGIKNPFFSWPADFSSTGTSLFATIFGSASFLLM